MVGTDIWTAMCHECGKEKDELTMKLCYKCDRKDGVGVRFYEKGVETSYEKISLPRLLIIIIFNWKEWRQIKLRR